MTSAESALLAEFIVIDMEVLLGVGVSNATGLVNQGANSKKPLPRKANSSAFRSDGIPMDCSLSTCICYQTQTRHCGVSSMRH